MIRPVLALALLVLALALAEGWLAGRAARARASDLRVGTLFTRAEAESLRKQPALRIEQTGAQHAYGRVAGEWRCLSLFQAPADGRALQALLDGMLAAEGFVHARTVAEAPTYGINTPTTLRVSIQGPRARQDPSGDVLATLEIGLSLADHAGCFVRRRGSKEIWSIADDLRAELERRVAPGLPPLLAPAAVPASWLEASGGTRELAFERGGTRTVLERRERSLDPAELRPGALPWSWVLDPAGEARALEPNVAEAFVGFVERLPYVRVLDPAEREPRGLATPLARLRLTGRTGAPLELAFGLPDREGRVALWVEASATLYELEARVFALALPAPAELTASHEQGDPWSAAQRAAEARR